MTSFTSLGFGVAATNDTDVGRDERRAHDQNALRQVQGTRAPPAQASPTGR